MSKLVGLLAMLIGPSLAIPQPKEWGCMIDGDCNTDGTVGSHYLDEWGAANMGSDKDEGVCFGRAKVIWEYCANSPQQPIKATFLNTGKSATYPEGGGPDPGSYDYGDVLGKSMLFYEAQQSGYLKSSGNRIGWRGDSHTGDNGDGHPLDGGYYDAGDNLKFNWPMAYTSVMLAWSGIAYPEGYAKTGQRAYLEGVVRWATDYFIKCHVSDHEFYAQVGDTDQEHSYWGPPESGGPSWRPAPKIGEGNPGSDLAGETAAAFASAAILFKTSDPAYSATLLAHAKTMFAFADGFRGKYSDSINTGGPYGSYSYDDELVWAAAWLYRATGEQTYRDKAVAWYSQTGGNWNGASLGWDSKVLGSQVLMWEVTGDAMYKGHAVSTCDTKMAAGPWSPQGLLVIDMWGSLRHATTFGFACMLADDKFVSFAQSQINYCLGKTGRSFVVGYGVNPPTHCHHRGASCSNGWCADPNNPAENPNVIVGALVGGPSAPDDYYNDVRSDYVMNEVAMDYNAGFTGCLAGLVQKGL